MKIMRPAIWRRTWRILPLATLLIPLVRMYAIAQERGDSSFIAFRKIAVNFAPYLEAGEDEVAGARPPFAGQVVFAVVGDKLFVTITDSPGGPGPAVSPYWLQVNLENGELLKVEQVAEAQAKIIGKTTADKLSLSIAAPGDEALTAQISIDEPAPASTTVPPET